MTVGEPQAGVLAYSVCLSEEWLFRKPRPSQMERWSWASSRAVAVSTQDLTRTRPANWASCASLSSRPIRRE
jgi:hypothetical protein